MLPEEQRKHLETLPLKKRQKEIEWRKRMGRLNKKHKVKNRDLGTCKWEAMCYARQLGYGYEIVERIKEAQTEAEITRILTTARMR